MTDYAKLEKIDNRYSQVVALITTDKPLAAPRYISLGGAPQAPEVGWYYDGVNFSETLPQGVTAATQLLAPDQLWYGRLSNNERGRIWALADQDISEMSLTAVHRGRLKAFLAFSMSNPIRVTHPEAVKLFTALENAGAIAAGRAAEILA